MAGHALDNPALITVLRDVPRQFHLWGVIRKFRQWRTVRVSKEFSEYPAVSGKYFFEKAFSLKA